MPGPFLHVDVQVARVPVPLAAYRPVSDVGWRMFTPVESPFRVARREGLDAVASRPWVESALRLDDLARREGLEPPTLRFEA